ncbi:MAG: KH domain-containing protein [Clostridia bacterium]|nr:KH domain-containing protein [Clostridia bacterium]MBP5781291.1 KH domain-containing protein [Clostridia bacterium]
MEEFLINIVRQLVDDPDQVSVVVEENENNTVLKLSVAPEDMGRVIGREGRVARALRTVAKAAFRNNPKPVYIDIVDKAE